MFAVFRRNRFHEAVKGRSCASQNYMSCVDYDKHADFVITTELDGKDQVITEARYVTDKSDKSSGAEFALLIDDQWLRRGLGERGAQALMRPQLSATYK